MKRNFNEFEIPDFIEFIVTSHFFMKTAHMLQRNVNYNHGNNYITIVIS